VCIEDITGRDINVRVWGWHHKWLEKLDVVEPEPIKPIELPAELFEI
jgi:hypothetical protein